MIFYLIKNNLKLMLRSRWIIVVMVLGPILTIAILSSAFEDMMKTYEGTEQFSVGYSVKEGSGFAAGITEIEKAAAEQDMDWNEYPDGSPENLMKQNGLAGFVEMNEDDYIVYISDDYVVEGITLEYFMTQVVKNIKIGTLQAMLPEIQEEEAELAVNNIDFLPAVSAKDYYGIVYIVYFIWCGIVCIASVFSSEKKNGIDKKYMITSISGAGLFAAKWIPAVVSIVLEITVTVITTTAVFGIGWGNIPVTIVLLLLSVMASASFSLMLYYIIRNLAVTVIAVFSIVWFLAFFGGCFETYMFSSVPEFIKEMSPLYHTNRALVEYSTIGKSDYLCSSVVYLVIVAIVCASIAILVDVIRKRGKR